MKKLYYLFCFIALFLCLHSDSNAQTQKTYDMDVCQMVKSSKNLIYTFNTFETFNKKELITYSQTGELLKRHEFESTKRIEINEVCDMGDMTVFHMSIDGGDRLVVLDNQGNETATHDLTYTDKLRDNDIVCNSNGITIVSEVKRKKVGVGLLIQQFSKDASLLWSYEKFPEKGKYFIYDAAINSQGQVAILYKNGNVADYGLCVLSNSGEELVFTDIDEQKLPDFRPYNFSFSNETTLMLVSDYGSTSTETFKGIPLGMNVMTINVSNGEVINTQSLSFNDVQVAVGDKRSDETPIYQVGPALRVLDVQVIGGKSTFICESYIFKERQQSIPSKTAGAAPTVTYYKQLELLDFYLLNVEDISNDIHRIWKPIRTIEVEGSSFTSAEGLCDMFKYNRFFSYQGLTDNRLLIRGYGQMHNYLNVINPADSYESLVTRQYWGDPLNCNPSANPPYHSYNKSGSTFIDKDLARTGVLQTKVGYMLFHYNSVTNTISFEPITF